MGNILEESEKNLPESGECIFEFLSAKFVVSVFIDPLEDLAEGSDSNATSGLYNHSELVVNLLNPAVELHAEVSHLLFI